MSYEVLVVSAHPDDAEVQMGGTIAKLVGESAAPIQTLLGTRLSQPARPPIDPSLTRVTLAPPWAAAAAAAGQAPVGMG